MSGEAEEWLHLTKSEGPVGGLEHLQFSQTEDPSILHPPGPAIPVPSVCSIQVTKRSKLGSQGLGCNSVSTPAHCGDVGVCLSHIVLQILAVKWQPTDLFFFFFNVEETIKSQL